MPITIDGSKFEGGGSMLRIALACSLATGKAFRMINIRKNRDNPGLRPQHIASVKLSQMISSSYSEGAELGSEEIMFIPAKVQSGIYEVDIGTAGSIPLCVQSAILPIVFSGNNLTLRLKGGTDVSSSPGIDYFRLIFSQAIRQYAQVKTDTIRRGYYPKGGGRVDFRINSKYTSLDANSIPGIDFSGSAQPNKISLNVNASKDLSGARVIERLSEYFSLLARSLNIDTAISQSYNDSECSGGSATLILNSEDSFIGETFLFEKGVKAEGIADKIYARVKSLIGSGTKCDKHLADQLVPFIAASGKGCIKTEEITEHCRANAYVCNEFFDGKVEINEEKRLIFIKKEDE